MKLANLASRPFRNERTPALLFGLFVAALLGATAWHAVVLVRLTGRQQAGLFTEAAQLEAEASRLRAEAGSLRSERPSAATVARWGAIRDLVDRRVFSWTLLLAQLEAILPPQVRLVSITPSVSRGRMTLDLVAQAEDAEAGLALVDVLQKQGPFVEVYPKGIEQREQVAEFSYTMRYLSRPRVLAPGPAPSPAASASPGPADPPEGGEP